MFKKILIANRGEIACRVIKTARKMGIQTVAVYSDIDANALHVSMADEAVLIGEAAAASSYLVADKIIAACKQTGAEALHPGYGFLSENADFCQRLQKEGITFIGPDVHAIVSMGDKMTSKKLAAEAGVNTVPGYEELIEDADHAVKVSADIGYPVMIKASAGGGGKGMRVAYDEKGCREGFERAKNEAASSFGDDRILIEKFIEQPRHIEIQIIADKHGNCVYLGERECSIQRRHQKIIEEAPSPFLDKKTRKAMGEQAVALAKAVDYHSAGTVEFIVDKDRNFYFLEMNTRLQVEHPVTEKITGLDLVELMLSVANGEELPLAQKDVKLNGWAVETRIYAEDPVRNFLPSTGRVTHYIPPAESPNVRIDTGFIEGSEVSIFYDPMIAKLITWGKDRHQAIEFMRCALDAYYIRGIRHNISFLGAILGHERFLKGNLTTSFIEEEYPEGFDPASLKGADRDGHLLVAVLMHNIHKQRAAQISGQFRDVNLPKEEKLVVLENRSDGKAPEFQVDIRRISGGALILTLHEQTYEIMTRWQPGEPLLHCNINESILTFQTRREGIHYLVAHHGHERDLIVFTQADAALYTFMPEKEIQDTSRQLVSPMPGLIIKLSVKEGQEVKAGEELVVIEAMKMENILVAERDATIANICVDLNESVSVDQTLIEFE